VVGVLGAQEGGPGLRHRGTRFGEVMAGLGQHPADDTTEEGQLPGLGRSLALFEQAEDDVLDLRELAEQVPERALRILLGESTHVLADLVDDLRGRAGLPCQHGELLGSLGSHGQHSSLVCRWFAQQDAYRLDAQTARGLGRSQRGQPQGHPCAVGHA
jgi:hypothetical protein